MDLYRWIKHQWDRTAAVIATLVGLLSLLAGWLGVSRSSLATEQIPYLASGAVFGLFSLGVGATLWLSADLRDEWRMLNDLRRSVEAAESSEAAAADTQDRADTRDSARSARSGGRRRATQPRLTP